MTTLEESATLFALSAGDAEAIVGAVVSTNVERLNV